MTWEWVVLISVVWIGFVILMVVTIYDQQHKRTIENRPSMTDLIAGKSSRGT